MTSAPDFDRVARPYRWMEYLSFGRALARCRCARIPELAGARRALVLGDGDGRFLARLLRAHPALEVDAVDASASMLRLLGRRVTRAGAAARVRLHHADIRAFAFPAGNYDLVVTHFFLDCLTDAELDALLQRLLPVLAPRARWIISEFAIPDRGPRRHLARAVVGGLYLAFGLLTGLRVRRLPNHAVGLARAGFRCASVRTSLAGLLRTELWQLPSGGGAEVP